MNTARSLIPLLLLLLLFSSCNVPRDDQAANQLVEKLHKHWQQQQWDAMLSSYDKTFFTGKNKLSWREELLSYDQSLGSLKTIKLIKSQVDARYSGDFYIYSFRLHFERADLREVITVYKPLNASHLGIVGHVLNKVGGGS
ncbi:MAG: hypothetical protein Q9M22_02610 [Mariprofundaceae bacterium]|nr:hypothetical protein [Mariprofundaceae bacterium]